MTWHVMNLETPHTITVIKSSVYRNRDVSPIFNLRKEPRDFIARRGDQRIFCSCPLQKFGIGAMSKNADTENPPQIGCIASVI